MMLRGMLEPRRWRIDCTTCGQHCFKDQINAHVSCVKTNCGLQQYIDQSVKPESAR